MMSHRSPAVLEPPPVDAGTPVANADAPRIIRSTALVALFVAALAAATASTGMTRRRLWYDEYATWFVGTLSWSDFRRLIGNTDIVHALYYLVMRQWTAVFGDSVLALRLPSIIGFAVASGALVLLGRRLSATLTGAVAGLIYLAIPAASRFAQEARSYAWVSAVGLLATLALLRALDRPRWSRWLLYGGCVVILVHLHVVAALLLPVHALLVARVAVGANGAAARRWWGWALTSAAAGLLAAPLLFEASTQTGQIAWVPADGQAVRQYLPHLFGSPTVAWVLVPLGLLGAAVLWYTGRWLLAVLLSWVALPPVICYLIYPAAHLFLPKYALFTLPAWALLAATALVVPLTALRRWMLALDVGALLVVALVLIASAGVHAQVEIRRVRLTGEPDFKAAAAFIDDRFRPGDGIAYAGFTIVGGPRQPVAYELKTWPHDVFASGPPGSHGWYGVPECPVPSDCFVATPRIWLLANSKLPRPLDGMPPAQAALLRQRYAVTSTGHFDRVDVVLLVRR